MLDSTEGIVPLSTIHSDNGSLARDGRALPARKPGRTRAPSAPILIGIVCVCLAALSWSAVGCGPSAQQLRAVDYAPVAGEDWPISTPEDQGLDPLLIARLYYDAAKVETIRSLLVVKNGYLVAERYFRGGSAGQEERLQSVTKSFTSALVGIALDQGYLSSADEKMMDFFPELAGRLEDPRKNEITIRQMLEMRAGYPWEESTGGLFDMLYRGFRPSLLADVPLVRDPGTDFDYSNLSAHLLGVIVARATGSDLLSFARENLFGPVGIQPGEWIKDWEGYYNGHADLYLTARDMAKFGLLYLNKGRWEGRKIVPEAWVRDSLRTYSEDAWYFAVGDNVAHMGYGYLWWSAQAGEHRYNFAWGHGGQQIALVAGLDMVIVVAADPLVGQHGGGPWSKEKENLNLVGDFISTLPVR